MTTYSEREITGGPRTQRDIVELQTRITSYTGGGDDDERFRGYRLARGIYGQRQPGVQMIRIKLPFGRISTAQLRRIADVADEYASGNLHLTTRQDVQIHYVLLGRTPDVWRELDLVGITLREACGNTVRNITASASAGIDPDEPFDVTPYAYATFGYFLRNPVCQELGRKFKIAFASSERDTAYAFIHDVGLIPRVRHEGGEQVRGFRVVIGGGLGAQPVVARAAHEFLPEHQLIPFIEGLLRVFDRYGERTNRNKARMKYLAEKIGLDALLALVEQERRALKEQAVMVDHESMADTTPASLPPLATTEIAGTALDPVAFEAWRRANVFQQKQPGYVAAQIKVPLGNIPSGVARELAGIVERFAADDIRITVNQGLLLKFIRPELLPALHNELARLGLGEHGFGTTGDITACPGTDTCNLGIANSTALALELERVVSGEYPQYLFGEGPSIKISGCMNSCGQHGLAAIGLHGSSLKHGERVVPAVQVMLGGGATGSGNGRLAERIIKVPSRRAPDALRAVLDDYIENGTPDEPYIEYYQRQGRAYFTRLLKPFADLGALLPGDFVDWGSEQAFVPAIGVGECAGVVVDLVAILLDDAAAKLGSAAELQAEGEWADAIYLGYSALVTSAKALLLREDVACNTQSGIIDAFAQRFDTVPERRHPFADGFAAGVLRLRTQEPTEEFATAYIADAHAFVEWAKRGTGGTHPDEHVDGRHND